MTWPTDDLTKTHLDAGTDSPASARAELEALVDKVKAMLAEVTAGATVWHSGNDGATSTLDADKLDGQEGSYYLNGSNMSAGTVALARLPTGSGNGFDADKLDAQEGSYYLDLANTTGSLAGAKLVNASIGQTQIGAGAVGQSQLKTASNEQSAVFSTTGTAITLAHGTYSFAPEVRTNSGSYYLMGDGSLNMAFNNTAYGGVSISAKSVSGTGTLYAKSRYITASPPHKIGNLDFGPFLFLVMDSNKDVLRTSVSDDPPWYFEGPTNVRPDRIDSGGKKYKNVRMLPDNFDSLPRQLQLIAKAKAPIEEVEIDINYKNRDMPLFPHPFTHGELGEGHSVLIIEPDDKCYSDLISLREQGEDIPELLHSGFLKIGDESKSKDCPPGLCMHKLKWKNL